MTTRPCPSAPSCGSTPAAAVPTPAARPVGGGRAARPPAMRLAHSARIDAPVERVWAIVSDVPRAGRLVPGVGPVEPLGADRYRGTLPVQIGPVRLRPARGTQGPSRGGAGPPAAPAPP